MINNIHMKALLSSLVIFLLVCSCQFIKNTNREQLKIFNLKELPKVTSVKLSDLGFDDIEYIPLETNDRCLVPTINDIVIGKDYFLTHFFTQIYKFRFDGSFVSKIGTEGRGPNEFTVVHDLDIDIKNQNIYVVSAWQKKFFVYSESGVFIRSFQCPINTTNFRITEEGILCYNINSFGNVETSFNLIDSSGKSIKDFSNRYVWHLTQHNTYIFQNENQFYRFNNHLLKKEIYSDTVYSFINKDFKPYLVIEQGKRTITTKARSESNPEYIRDNFITPMNLFEFGNYIYYEFIVNLNEPGEKLAFIGSKISKLNALIYPEKGIINDLDAGPNIWPKTIKDDNSIVTFIDVIQLKKYIASEDFKNSIPKYLNKKKKLEKLANSLKETDNPVLMVVRLKK
jgi:hypothetical protein